MNVSLTYATMLILWLMVGCSQQPGNEKPEQEGEDISINLQNDTEMDNDQTPDNNGNEGIIMTLDPPTLVADNIETAVLRIVNNTGEKLTYGLRYTIEASDNGDWKKLDYLDDILFEDLAYEVDPGNENEETIRLKLEGHSYGKGLYRLCKSISLTEKDTTICTQFRVE